MNLVAGTACYIAALTLQSAAIATTIPDRMNLERSGLRRSITRARAARDWPLNNTDLGRFFWPMNWGRSVSVSSTLRLRADPVVLKQVPVEAEFVRCNSLGLSGNILVVARQSEKVGQPHGGVKICECSLRWATLSCFLTSI